MNNSDKGLDGDVINPVVHPMNRHPDLSRATEPDYTYFKVGKHRGGHLTEGEKMYCEPKVLWFVRLTTSQRRRGIKAIRVNGKGQSPQVDNIPNVVRKRVIEGAIPFTGRSVITRPTLTHHNDVFSALGKSCNNSPNALGTKYSTMELLQIVNNSKHYI